MEEVSCTETIDRVECTSGPWISPKKGLNHMTFFDLQTCAKCFTQKVGYEIGYNSSFMQQLPEKNKPGRFASRPLCPMQSNLWIAGNGENHWCNSASHLLPHCWVVDHVRSTFTLRPNTICSTFEGYVSIHRENIPAVDFYAVTYIRHNWRHSLSKQVLHVKQHWLWRPIRETSQWSEYINGSSYLLFDTILKGVYPAQI